MIHIISLAFGIWLVKFAFTGLIRSLRPNQSEYNDSIEPEQTNEYERIEHENSIVFYEIQIEQLKELSALYQAELDRTTDAKRKRTLLARCISLDKQTYNAQQKLNKLKKDV